MQTDMFQGRQPPILNCSLHLSLMMLIWTSFLEKNPKEVEALENKWIALLDDHETKDFDITVTNGGDRKKLCTKYQKQFKGVCEAAKELYYTLNEWNDNDIKVLCASLPSYKNLKKLYLSGNNFSMVGVETLVETIKDKKMDLELLDIGLINEKNATRIEAIKKELPKLELRETLVGLDIQRTASLGIIPKITKQSFSGNLGSYSPRRNDASFQEITDSLYEAVDGLIAHDRGLDDKVRDQEGIIANQRRRIASLEQQLARATPAASSNHRARTATQAPPESNRSEESLWV